MGPAAAAAAASSATTMAPASAAAGAGTAATGARRLLLAAELSSQGRPAHRRAQRRPARGRRAPQFALARTGGWSAWHSRVTKAPLPSCWASTCLACAALPRSSTPPDCSAAKLTTRHTCTCSPTPSPSHRWWHPKAVAAAGGSCRRMWCTSRHRATPHSHNTWRLPGRPPPPPPTQARGARTVQQARWRGQPVQHELPRHQLTPGMPWEAALARAASTAPAAAWCAPKTHHGTRPPPQPP